MPYRADVCLNHGSSIRSILACNEPRLRFNWSRGSCQYDQRSVHFKRFIAQPHYSCHTAASKFKTCRIFPPKSHNSNCIIADWRTGRDCMHQTFYDAWLHRCVIWCAFVYDCSLSTEMDGRDYKSNHKTVRYVRYRCLCLLYCIRTSCAYRWPSCSQRALTSFNLVRITIDR